MNIRIGVRGYDLHFAFPYGDSVPVSGIFRALSFSGSILVSVLVLFVANIAPALGSEPPSATGSFNGSEWSELQGVTLASNDWVDSVIQTLQDQNRDHDVGSATCNWDLTVSGSVFYKTPWLIYKDNPTEMHIYFETIPGVDADSNHRQVNFDESGVSVSINSHKITVDDGDDSLLFDAFVTGLTPGQAYTYTVKARQYDVWPANSWDCFKGSFFAAADENWNTLSFYGFGDQKYIDSDSSGNISKIVDKINSHWAPNTFVINTGDMVLNGGNHRPFGTSYWDEYWLIEHNAYFLGSMPMFTAMGNHDFQVNKDDTNCMYYANCDESVKTTDSGKSNPDKYYRYFPYPHAPDGEAKDAYYHFSYGPAHFWSLDTWPTNNDELDGYCGSSDNLKPESAQYQWFVNTIEAIASDPAQQWKIVFMHNPPFSPDVACNQPDLQQYWVPLFEKYGVDLVLTGHEHYYSRKLVNDIQYLILGGGGAGLSDFAYPENVDVVLKQYHFGYFSIDHDKMAVGIHNESGDLIDTFEVDRTPQASWSSELQSRVYPLNVQFTDNSTGNIYLWDWDFGDGTTLTGSTEEYKNPVHEYEDYGNYTATLTVKSRYNVSAHTGAITITPIADFEASQTEGPSPLDVQFIDRSEGVISEYLWDFGDSTTSSEQDPGHTFNNNGSHSVTLTVTTNNGITDTKSISNLIKVEPYADFQSNYCYCGIRDKTCVVNFENNSQGDNLTYDWDFDDGTTSTEHSPTHNYSCYPIPSINVQLTVTDSNGLSDTISKNLEFRPSVPM